MTPRVIGAGVGRTGTNSLKLALERLLGGTCYHMFEVFDHPEHLPIWHAAARGEPMDWRALLDGYSAAVDWPVAAFWAELMEVYPDALVVLSVRDPERWYESASETIFPAMMNAPDEQWRGMLMDLMANRFTSAIDDREACIEAYRRHNARVRETVPASRLLEWSPGDGWAPLAHALGMAVPDEPFPKANTRDEFPGNARGAASHGPAT